MKFGLILHKSTSAARVLHVQQEMEVPISIRTDTVTLNLYYIDADNWLKWISNIRPEGVLLHEKA